MMTVTDAPAWRWRRMVPPGPMTSSSGCGASTKTGLESKSEIRADFLSSQGPVSQRRSELWASRGMSFRLIRLVNLESLLVTRLIRGRDDADSGGFHLGDQVFRGKLRTGFAAEGRLYVVALEEFTDVSGADANSIAVIIGCGQEFH